MQLVGLAGRVAVVTGAARGLGLAAAERLACEGVHLALADPDGVALAAAARRLDGQGPRVTVHAGDPADAAAVARLAAQVQAVHGAVAFLVNVPPTPRPAAGTAPSTPPSLATIDDAVWAAVLATHLQATFLHCRALLPALEQPGGRIVNVLAPGARDEPAAQGAHLAAAAGGVIGLTRALAVELGPLGIIVNALAPGEIAAPRERGWQRPPLALAEQAQRLAQTPLGRVGRPAEVASLVALLLSDAGGYISGAIIDVNGGRYLAP